MLVAMDKLTQTDTLASDAIKGTEYICPHCDQPVNLKQGLVKIHHFSHKTLADCPYGSGETVAHRNSKLQLHTALLNSGFSVVLEKRLDNRIADIALGDHGVIELQHSSCHPSLFKERIEDYHRMGKQQLWLIVLSEQKITDMVQTGELRINQTLKWFRQLNYGKHVWIHDVEGEQLIKVNWWHRKKTIGVVEVIKRLSVNNLDFVMKPREAWESEHTSLPKMDMINPFKSSRTS